MSSVETRIRSANPAAAPVAMDATKYEKIFELVLERSRPQPSRSEHPDDLRRWSLAALAVVLTAALVGLAMFERVPHSISAANEPAVELTKAYIEARNSWDVTAADALLDPELVPVEYPLLRNRSELGPAFEFLGLVEEHLTIRDCTVAHPIEHEVVCDYEMENRLTRRAESGTIVGSLRVRTDGRKIVALENSFDFEDHHQRVVDPFLWSLDAQVLYGAQEMYRPMFSEEQVVWVPRLEDLETLRREIEVYAPTG